MEIIVKNKAIEEFLHKVAEAYRTVCPRQYEDFRRHVEQESAGLIRRNGMSPDGHFLNFMYIPQTLYMFIKYEALKAFNIDDFFRDSNNYRLLKKVWKDAATKTTPTHSLDLGATRE